MKKNSCVSPHADDEILGCGGFISKYSKLKYNIFVLILTNANKGAPEIFSEEKLTRLEMKPKRLITLLEQVKYFLKIYQH